VFTVFAFLILSTYVLAETVDRVIDGDTVSVVGVGAVRLIGVDTPETVHPRQPVQEFGREARAFLQGLIGGKAVRLEYDQTRRDRYGRTLAYLYLADGTFVNAEIVKQGYGHAYTEFPFRYLEQFRQFEREARAAGRGLWSSAGAAPSGSSVATTTETVYVTKTGEKYHRASCPSLARSQIPMSLAEAAARYGACSICKPPTLASPAEAAPPASAPKTVAQPAPVSAGRCQAVTKRGSQCSRRAQAGSNYCWQHTR